MNRRSMLCWPRKVSRSKGFPGGTKKASCMQLAFLLDGLIQQTDRVSLVSFFLSVTATMKFLNGQRLEVRILTPVLNSRTPGVLPF